MNLHPTYSWSPADQSLDFDPPLLLPRFIKPSLSKESERVRRKIHLKMQRVAMPIWSLDEVYFRLPVSDWPKKKQKREKSPFYNVSRTEGKRIIV